MIWPFFFTCEECIMINTKELNDKLAAKVHELRTAQRVVPQSEFNTLYKKLLKLERQFLQREDLKRELILSEIHHGERLERDPEHDRQLDELRAVVTKWKGIMEQYIPSVIMRNQLAREVAKEMSDD